MYGVRVKNLIGKVHGVHHPTGDSTYILYVHVVHAYIVLHHVSHYTRSEYTVPCKIHNVVMQTIKNHGYNKTTCYVL